MPALSQHVCFRCRKVFKKPHDYIEGGSGDRVVYRCPQCRQNMVFMGYKFRAPAMSDTDEWRHIERCVAEGRAYGVRTVRKPNPKPKVSPQLRVALGTYGERQVDA